MTLSVNQTVEVGGAGEGDVEIAGIVIGCPLTVMFCAVVCSCTCTVLYTPGRGSTPSNAAAPTTMFIVAPAEGAVKV